MLILAQLVSKVLLTDMMYYFTWVVIFKMYVYVYVLHLGLPFMGRKVDYKSKSINQSINQVEWQ